VREGFLGECDEPGDPGCVGEGVVA
jgi:hypothetical protein